MHKRWILNCSASKQFKGMQGEGAGGILRVGPWEHCRFRKNQKGGLGGWKDTPVIVTGGKNGRLINVYVNENLKNGNALEPTIEHTCREGGEKGSR